MSFYNFRKDLEDSKLAEVVVKKFLEAKLNREIPTLAKERQGEGDLDVGEYTVEVKYDKMAASTGNLCFEVANGAGKSTGVAATKAKFIYYVVPRKAGFSIYEFDTNNLRSFLFDTGNSSKMRIVNGGDRRAYTLMLVSESVVLENKLAVVSEVENA